MRSFYSAPHPPPPPLSRHRVSIQYLSLYMCRWSSLMTGEGGSGRARSQILQGRESLALFKEVLR
jgi:hypothetical protein